MSKQFDWEKFYIEKTDDGKSFQVVKKDTGARSKPKTIEGSLEELSKNIGKTLVAMGLLNKEQTDTFSEQFLSFLLEGPPKTPTEDFLFTEEPKPVPTVTTEKPVVLPEEPEKPKTEVPSDQLVMRYQELSRAKVPHEYAIQTMANETGLLPQAIEQLLPKVTPLSQQITPPSPPPVIHTGGVTLSENVIQDLKSLPSAQREWIKKLAELYHTDEKTFVMKCVEEAEKSSTPMHWQNRLLQYSIQHQLFSMRKERCIHATFAHTDGVIEACLPPEMKLEIDKCYQIEETGKLGRLIARSIGTKPKELFPNVPYFKSVKEVGDIGTIYHSFDVMKSNIKKLSDIYERLKSEKEGITDVVCGTIVDARGPYTDNSIWYLTINDGSPLPYNWMVSVELPSDNPFGIDDAQIRVSTGKTAFVYGFMKLIPPSESYSKDSIKIVPEFLVLG